MDTASEVKKDNTDVLNQAEKKSVENDQNVEIEKTLISWKSPSRPFKKKSRQFYITIISITSFVGLIIFLAEGIWPVILLASVIFLYFVLNTVPPSDVEHKITNKALYYYGKKIAWPFLTKFCFQKKQELDFLVFETTFIPNRLDLIIPSELNDEIRKIVSKYCYEEDIKPTNTEKFIDWVSNRLPN